jgi:hypothetical protein
MARRQAWSPVAITTQLFLLKKERFTVGGTTVKASLAIERKEAKCLTCGSPSSGFHDHALAHEDIIANMVPPGDYDVDVQHCSTVQYCITVQYGSTVY